MLGALLTEISKYFKINMEIELRVDKTLFKKNKFGRDSYCANSKLLRKLGKSKYDPKIVIKA